MCCAAGRCDINFRFTLMSMSMTDKREKITVERKAYNTLD